MMNKKLYTVGNYIVDRLLSLGITDIFGVPGDFNLKLLDYIVDSDLNMVNTCNELNAGYAADGYARVKGAGALVITYGVGCLSALNAVAGSYAEDIPVIVITGGPARKHYEMHTPIHHTLGDYEKTSKMFEMITIGSGVLKDLDKIPEQIDNFLRKCILNKKPVYIEVPSDVVDLPCPEPEELIIEMPRPNLENLDKSVNMVIEKLLKSDNPIILAGQEINKYGLQEEFSLLLAKTGYPFATMLLDKSVISEDHPQFIGYYEGAQSKEYVRNRVENSTAILCLGAYITDSNLGWGTAKLPFENMIFANKASVKTSEETYEKVYLQNFLEKLIEGYPDSQSKKHSVQPAMSSYYTCNITPFQANNSKRITISRFFERMTCFIQENDIIVSDVGTALFGLSQMLMPKNVNFIDQSYYCSIGYSVGAALGASVAALDRRVLTFVGDGAFQMTAQEISTMIRIGVKPLVFVINNEGYTIERYIHDGPYNDISSWHYHKLPEVFAGRSGIDVYTEGQLEEVLASLKDNNEFALIEVHFEKMDSSESMKAILNLFHNKS